MFEHEGWGEGRPAFAWQSGFGPGGPRGPWGGQPGWEPSMGRWFGHMARHFPFGPGMGRMGPRMFGRGNLKYALLEMLLERPKHGYEMMKELEEKSNGFYVPSAGAIYPTLQLLEDRGWVTNEVSEGKKVYAINDAGRAALEEHRKQDEVFGGPRGWGEHGPHHGHGPFGGPFGRHSMPELRALRQESAEVARLMRAAVMASAGNPERLGALREIVARARNDLNTFLGQGGSTPQGPASPTGDAPVEHL
jgi:DNA-binding PadR family transcriptional regulator